MGWFIAGCLVGWFVPQPDWKALGAKILSFVTTRGLK